VRYKVGLTGQVEGGITLSDCNEQQCCRVDIWHEGAMGTICDDGVDDKAAIVICRQIGYVTEGATVVVGGSGYGATGMVPGDGEEIWLDSVNCNGNEEHIYDCDHQPWAQHNCIHKEDLGVCCPGGRAIEAR